MMNNYKQANEHVQNTDWYTVTEQEFKTFETHANLCNESRADEQASERSLKWTLCCLLTTAFMTITTATVTGDALATAVSSVAAVVIFVLKGVSDLRLNRYLRQSNDNMFLELSKSLALRHPKHTRKTVTTDQ